MIAQKNAFYDVDFGYDGAANVLTIFNVDVHAGEDIEQVAFDFVSEVVKEPDRWAMTDARVSSH
jgi:hypothetical protein